MATRKKEEKATKTTKRKAPAKKVEENVTKTVATVQQAVVSDPFEKAKKPNRKVFKISMTAVYNNEGMEAEAIADSVFEAMTKVGKGLALLHVDSVKPVAKPDKAIIEILDGVSHQSTESMNKVKAEDGSEYVSVKKDKD